MKTISQYSIAIGFMLSSIIVAPVSANVDQFKQDQLTIAQKNKAATGIRAFESSLLSQVRKTDKGEEYRTKKNNAQTSYAIKTKKKVKNSNETIVRYRTADIKSVQDHEDYEIYDAQISLSRDQDMDGLYSAFDLEFDVDVVSGIEPVYAEIFYRSNLSTGQPWKWLYTTNIFEINGNSSLDSFSVLFYLSEGFPPDEYELLIDIYQADLSELVVTYGADDDVDLYSLPLEDSSWDLYLGEQIDLDFLSLELYDDNDGDGHYSGYDLKVDLLNVNNDRMLEVRLYSRDSISSWYLETTSEMVWLNQGDLVEFSFSAQWMSGYPLDYYDFLIEVVDVNTGELIGEFGPELIELSQNPMESNDFDTVNENPVVVIIDDGHSGGGIGYLTFILLLMIYYIRKRVERSELHSSSGNDLSKIY